MSDCGCWPCCNCCGDTTHRDSVWQFSISGLVGLAICTGLNGTWTLDPFDHPNVSPRTQPTGCIWYTSNWWTLAAGDYYWRLTPVTVAPGVNRWEMTRFFSPLGNVADEANVESDKWVLLTTIWTKNGPNVMLENMSGCPSAPATITVSKVA